MSLIEQVVTSIPSHHLVKLKCSFGSKSGQEIEMLEKQVETDDDDLSDELPRGQILWIRGLTRLQHQVIRGVISTFS